jgi:thiamine biosynthesis lipoprotein ApbE
MNQRRWNASWMALVIVLLAAAACGKKNRPIPGRMYSGVFFGEPYQIEVVGDSTNYGDPIDSILHAFEKAYYLGDSTSILSRYNRYQTPEQAFIFYDSSRAFGLIYDLARDFNRRTKQYFDPTTNPLKREWMITHFKGSNAEPNLDSLYEFVGFDGAKMDLNEVEGEHHEYLRSQMRKGDARIEADFTPLATAYALDQVAELLRAKKVPQFRITRGHQVICNGAAMDSINIVLLGISGSNDDQRVRLLNRAFSFKGLPEKTQMVENELVYVGVSARTLAESEVFSEAFMIMGLDAASKWYEENENSDVQSFMIVKRGEELSTASTEAFDQMLVVPDSVKQNEPRP